MSRRIASIVAVGMAFLGGVALVHQYFFDILPLASTEQQYAGRFDAAFLVAATLWIAIAVVAATSIWIVMLWRRSARSRAGRQEPPNQAASSSG